MTIRAEPMMRVQRTLPATREVGSEARFALLPLGAALPDGCFDDLRLLVTELVTNSLRHACGGRPGETIDLLVESRPGYLYVEVVDAGPGFEPPTTPRPPEEGGLGLYLLGRIARRWGVRRTYGTCVWFEMDL